MSNADSASSPIVHSEWPWQDHAPRRLVLKVGSNVLALSGGGLNEPRIAALCASIAKVRAAGTEVILVSSGAVAAGRGLLKLKERPGTLPELQAVAAIGQGALMEAYTRHLRPLGLLPAQLLLTRDDMDERRRYLNIRHSLAAILRHPAIPVINENDTVTVDELKFGDNDMLSAMVAAKMDSDLLVIMSNVPGLMTAHPKVDPNARLIPMVKEITPDIEGLAHTASSNFGTGGMKTKLLAARHSTQFGVHCVIVDGGRDGQLEAVVSGAFTGTWFQSLSSRRAGGLRRHWIGSARVKGDIVVDDGAQNALINSHKSLLAIGIKAVIGHFEKGDVVRILNADGADLAHGVVNYDRDAVDRIRGKKGEEIRQVLGEVGYPEVIHCDNLVLTYSATGRKDQPQ